MGVSTRYLQDLFQVQMPQNNDKELNLKIQNYNLISIRVNRPTTIHLRFQRKSTSYTFFF
jgi:hypothetical protein